MPPVRRVALNKRLTIQRRLAWSLSKNDTQNLKSEIPFFFYCGVDSGQNLRHDFNSSLILNADEIGAECGRIRPIDSPRY